MMAWGSSWELRPNTENLMVSPKTSSRAKCQCLLVRKGIWYLRPPQSSDRYFKMSPSVVDAEALPPSGREDVCPRGRVLVVDSTRSGAALQGLCPVKRCLAQVTAFLRTDHLQQQTAVPAPSPQIKNLSEGLPQVQNSPPHPVS